ncbi:hypothetical protein CBR_g37930 [Chara braunii]|uniref:non-specific serine/threonine protein kinase n=1 Tax=Chara braunii TaxID=69332 RepID=A0A388LPA2_CHABU|nr:hypothetical protein CBR_g37930 [Chara braunii]|eukprot:GBG84055.1 hypothetical protein CBR_g37930 [Chara braunii]
MGNSCLGLTSKRSVGGDWGFQNSSQTGTQLKPGPGVAAAAAAAGVAGGGAGGRRPPTSAVVALVNPRSITPQSDLPPPLPPPSPPPPSSNQSPPPPLLPPSPAPYPSYPPPLPGRDPDYGDPDMTKRRDRSIGALDLRKPVAMHLPKLSVLNRKTENLKDLFVLGKELGRGQFGITFLCTEKRTGKQYACKSIRKRKLVQSEDVEDVKREIRIMHHLTGHPNIVTFQGAYEDSNDVHLVMELCEGGELFERIVQRGHYSEKAAAGLIRTIVGVVEQCHSLGVMHRDLKPENFLLANRSDDSPLKTIDFGLSIFFKPGEQFRDIVGSPFYIAPEVLKKNYGPEADIWSAGVILYILLCGLPPFWAETDQGIFDAVLAGVIPFDNDPWPSISESAKELIRRMLEMDPKKRITARKVLEHSWVREDGDASDIPLDHAVLVRLKQFSAMNKFKKLAVKVIAASLSEEEMFGLMELFRTIDVDNSNTITFEELKNGLAKMGCMSAESELRQLMSSADVDGNGTLDYSEFLAATVHLNKVEKVENLNIAFQYFDKDGSGYITVDELEQAMSEHNLKDRWPIEDIISEVDQNQDGKIDYQEFVSMMTGGNGIIRRRSLRASMHVQPVIPEGST